MRLWCLVPAAGSGSRMGGAGPNAVPKQYLPLCGRPLLAWTLDALLELDPIGLVLVLAPGDDRAATADWIDPRVERIAAGGADRAASVLAGLRHLGGRAGDDDWVLVHDAARPCIDVGLVRSLLEQVRAHPVGGLLAVPVADTVKQARSGPDEGAGRRERGAEVEQTLDRRHLWLAQTPQVFRFARLSEALEAARDSGRTVTDEAAAIEALGGAPLLVPGSVANLKVTHPEDLPLAEFWLRRQRKARDESPVGTGTHEGGHRADST